MKYIYTYIQRIYRIQIKNTEYIHPILNYQAAMSDLISEAPLMNIKNTYIYIHTYINNMQHYLLYIGDKTTTKKQTRTTTTK